MKRTFQEFDQGQKDLAAAAATEAQNTPGSLYDFAEMRRKVDQQRIGDFIVKGLNSVHFKIVSEAAEVEDDTTGSYFAPKFLYWLVGQEERIQGYEGLQVIVCLSAKRLTPFLKVKYAKKAPPFAKIDDIEQLISKHYGSVYTDLAKYKTEVLDTEASADSSSLPGAEYKVFGEQDQIVRRVCLSDATFHDQNYFLQALLPFFIEGAVIVEPSPFWSYFMVYEKSTNRLMAYFTVYEAHLSFDRYRTKVSQVLVLPAYQRRGIASRVYSLIYDEYRLHDDKCFQLMVEDAAEDFQKVQDTCHASVLKATLKKLSLNHNSPYKAVPDLELSSAEQVKERQLSLEQVSELAKLLKLPPRIVLQVNDLLLFSRLPAEQSSEAWTAYRFAIKRRFYVRCQHLFPGAAKKLNPLERQTGISEAYIWNEVLEDDQFARNIGQEAGGAADEHALSAIGGMAGKIQLNTMFDELVKMFDQIRPKIAALP